MLKLKELKTIRKELKEEKGIKASLSEIKVLAGDWLNYSEKEARINDFAAHATDASLDFMIHESGDSYDMLANDYQANRNQLYNDLKQQADFTEDELKEYLEIGVQYDEDGEPTGERDEDAELEDYLTYLKGDNTYNWSWLGPGDANIGIYEDPNTGLYFLELRFHIGTDIRGGYTDNYYYKADSEDDAYYKIHELFGGSISAHITFDDGSSFSVWSQQDSDIPYFDDWEVKGGGKAEEFAQMLESTKNQSDVDEMIESLCEKVHKVNKTKNEDEAESGYAEAEFLTNSQVIDRFVNEILPSIYESNPGQNDEDLEELIDYEFGLFTDSLHEEGLISEEQLDEISYSEASISADVDMDIDDVMEGGKKEEDKTQEWLASGKGFGKEPQMAWSDGDTLYSYKTIIAKKKGKKLYVNITKYSNTTSKFVSALKRMAEQEGFEVIEKEEGYFGTSMEEKLPIGVGKGKSSADFDQHVKSLEADFNFITPELQTWADEIGVEIIFTEMDQDHDKIGIHLRDADEDLIIDALEQAEKDMFPAIYIHVNDREDEGQVDAYSHDNESDDDDAFIAVQANGDENGEDEEDEEGEENEDGEEGSEGKSEADEDEDEEDNGREVTKTFKVYKFDKAPKHIKEKIRDELTQDPDYGQYMLDERIETLKKLAERLNLALDYSLSVVPDRGEFISMKAEDEDSLEQVNEAIKEFVNDETDCPLTGVCYDEDIKDAIKNNGSDYEGLQIALDEYLKGIHSEYESMCEDDYLADFCDANEYEFTKDGKIYS